MLKRVMVAVVAMAAASGATWGAEPVSFLNKETHTKWGAGAPDWEVSVPGHKAVAPGEHPRLVFRKGDVERLKQRAQTPEGKVIVDRLRKLLDGTFTLSHPAGYGLLYQITGEQPYADKARELVIEILEGKKLDGKDKRYGFLNPGHGGDMRGGPAIGVMGLAYDLNYGGWDADFRTRVAKAILENPLTAKIARQGPIGPGCNHYTAAVGGVGVGLLAVRGDEGVDAAKVDELLASTVKQVKADIAQGYGDKGYFFEGHQCGRISSNTGLVPFVQAYRTAAGKDLVGKNENARWLAAKWVYEFAVNPDGKYTDAQRGMYARDFPRGGMWSENGDFAQGFGVCPPEFVPALKWVYENQVEPGAKTYDVLDYPAQAVYALANWPIDVKAVSPADQPELFPKVMYDAAAGHVIFRNGWSGKGDDILVSALLGTHPTNGRGMAAGGSTKKNARKMNLEMMANNAHNPNPVSNHYGLQVGGAGLTLLALMGDPELSPEQQQQAKTWYENGVFKQALKVMTEDYGQTGYFAEHGGPGVIGVSWTFTPWLAAERIAAGRDWLSNPAWPNPEWLSLQYAYKTLPTDKAPMYANPVPGRGGYGGDVLEQEGGHHAGYFSQGFGAIQPKHAPALLWVYTTFVEPLEAKQYADALPDGQKSFDTFAYPHRPMYALVNWPFGVRPENPEKLLPKAVGDMHYGQFHFRNRWQDKDDIIVSVLFGARTADRDARRMMVWGLGQQLTFGAVTPVVRGNPKIGQAVIDTWTPYADGSGVVAAGGQCIAVDFSKASGADAVVAMTGPGATGKLGGKADAKKTKAHTVDAGGTPVAILTLSATGEHPTPAANGNTITLSGQTITVKNNLITFAKTATPAK